ncbi:hypothetical protein Y032_0101g3345 [Ancylostoma ceylanicum]|uniref:Mos1 transposase HTH domain-containing protein n=1 Tax=Ancylostoma ceylanicum TaxID=53326 RepID=A0A016THV7_9BILA|nr:hypothetical protein Y032_0101g3345 [Ancylostoma ceylanicum]
MAQIRTILLHEFKLGRKEVEGHENMVKAWGPDVISLRTTQLWFQKFRSGDTNLEDEPGRGLTCELDDDVLMSGCDAVKRAVHLFEEKYKNEKAVQAVWDQYQDGISKRFTEANASVQLGTEDGWIVSVLYYVPSSLLDYHASLMEIFFKAQVFHEIALSKYLYTVPTRGLFATGRKFHYLFVSDFVEPCLKRSGRNC